MFLRRQPPRIKPIWSDSNDVHVRNYVVYKNGDGVACTDPQGLYTISAKLLNNAFCKGLLISDNDVLYTPASMYDDDGTTKITYAKLIGDVITSATIMSFEPPEPIKPMLTSLEIGENTLAPEFSTDVYTYTTTTTDSSSLIVFDVLPVDTIVLVELDGVPVDVEEEIEWEVGMNVLTITLSGNGIEDQTVYTIAVTREVIPVNPILDSLTVGSSELVPTFDSGVFTYATTTTETSDILNFITVPDDVTTVVKHDGVEITDYAEGIMWKQGENVITITLGDNDPEIVYTVTVSATI